jgi:hypothetical protein
MSRLLLPIAAALALAGQAHAFTNTSTGPLTGPAPGDPGPSGGQVTVITFDPGALSGVLPIPGVATSIGDGITETVTGPVGLYTGNAYAGGSQVAAVPAGDQTQYEAIGTGGTATFDFAGYETTHTINSLSVYLGSIDPYNTITFLNASDGIIATLTGADFPADTGGQTASITNRRADFTFTPGDDFTSIEFSSSGVAFEYDTIAVGPTPTSVPEPATWVVMLVGVGLVGGARRQAARRVSGA